MKFLKTLEKYKKIRESIDGYTLPFRIDLKESISTTSQELLDGIQAQEEDIMAFFYLDEDTIDLSVDLDNFVQYTQFLQTLQNLDLRMGDVESTENIENFLNVKLKYVNLYQQKASDLSEPIYIIMQFYNDFTKHWNNIQLYKIEGNFANFYELLTSKTVEIEKESKTYIYSTHNSGMNWTLMNPTDEKETTISKDDMWQLMQGDIKVKVI